MKKLALLSCLLFAGAVGCGGGDDSALRSEKEKLESNVRNLEQEKILKQEEHDRLKAERDSLLEQTGKLQSEQNRNNTAFGEEKKSWADARQSLLDENADLQEKLREKSLLQDEQKKWTDANNVLNEEIARLKLVLQEEKDRYQREASASSTTNSKLNDDLNKLEKDLASLEESNKRLNKEVQQLGDDLRLAQSGSSDSARLSKEISDLRGENQELKDKNAKMVASLDGLTQQVNAMTATADQQTLKLAAQESQIGKLNTDKQSLETDNAALKKQLQEEKDRLRVSVQTLQQSNLELSNEVRDVKEALEKATQEGTAATSTIAELRDQLREAEGLRSTQESNYQSLLTEKSSNIIELEATIGSLKTERQDLLNEKAWLEEQLNKANRLVASLETDKTRLEGEIAELSKSNEDRKKEISQLQASLTRQRQESDAENTRLSELNENTGRQLEVLQKQRKEEVDAHSAFKTTTSAQIEALNASIKGLEAEKQTLLDEKVALQASIDKLKVEARRQDMERKNQIAEYDKLAGAKQSLDIDYEALQNQLESERNALKNKGNELISAKRELNRRIGELETLLNEERLKVSQKDESLLEFESKLAEEKRKGQEAIRAAEENERLRDRSEGSADSVVELHKQIQDLKAVNHNLKLNNDETKSAVEKLEKDLLARNDPHEKFKEASQEFLAGLRTSHFSEQYSKDQIDTFKEDVRYFANGERLLEEPEQDPKRLSVPLPLIFDKAPRPTKEFTVYIASAVDDWDDLEKTAQFILATDDKEMLEQLLVQKGKGELDYREFKVQVDYPILCLGPKIFMLPKALLNPLFENEMLKVIELNYGFDVGSTEPLEYQSYVEKKKSRDERLATSKNQAVKPELR